MYFSSVKNISIYCLGPPSISGCLVAICLLTEQRVMVFSLEEVSQHTLSQAENLSVFPSQVLPFALLKVYKTSPHANQNLSIWCADVCATADQVRWF